MGQVRQIMHRVFQVFKAYTHNIVEPPSALLIVGGGQSSVELVDLTDGGAESCISPVSAPNFFANAAGIWVDDKPTVCGGGRYYNDYTTDKCVSYNLAEGKWDFYDSLPEDR